jgi:hypothetical protein
MTVLSLTSGAATLLLCDAIRALPGNAHYERRVELLSAVQELLPRSAYWLAFGAFLLSFTMSNIGAIVESVKTMDSLLLKIFSHTYALEVAPRPGFRSVTPTSKERDYPDDVSPFGDKCWTISLGFTIVAAVTVPLGYYNLDESIWVQQFSFLALMAIVLVWLFCFTATGLREPLPAVGSDQSIMIGTLLFNYLFVATIPSWLNEKRPEVSVQRSVVLSVGVGTLIFAGLGVFASLAYEGFVKDDGAAGKSQLDLLDMLLSGADRVRLAAMVCAYAFPPVALLSGIPVLSICLRYNLLEQRVCPPRTAFFLSVLFPWLAALLLSYGDALASAIDWVSLFSAVPLNLVMPAWLFLRATASGHQLHLSPADLREAQADGDDLRSPLLTAGEGRAAGGWDFGGAAQPPPSPQGMLPRPGSRGVRGAWRELCSLEWTETALLRKRAGARCVIAVAVSLNFSAFIVKAATGE